MTAAPPDLYSQADLLVAAYERAGYARVAPAILQPAEPFLDLAGEDMRRHMYVLTDSAGDEFCLRPDLTIPVARDYLASPAAATAQPAGFCYLGPVFRDRGAGSGEFLQAGIELFGRTDTAAADAEALALGLEATAHYGINDPENPHRRRRAVLGADRRARSRPGVEAAARQGFQPQGDARRGSCSASRSPPPTAAPSTRACWRRSPTPTPRRRTRSSPICSRSPASARSAAARSARSPTASSSRPSSAPRTALPGETRAVIERFLGIAGTPDDAAASLRALAEEASLSLEPALDLFESRTGFLAATRRRCRPHPLRDRRSAAASTTTPASCSSCTTARAAPTASSSPAAAMMRC